MKISNFTVVDTYSKSPWFLICYTILKNIARKKPLFIAGIAKEKLWMHFVSIMVLLKPKTSKAENFYILTG